MRTYLIAFLFFVSIKVFSANKDALAPVDSLSWMVGVSKVKITPSGSIWMGGYAFRDHASEDILSDLYAKAIALVDKNGRKAVIVTADLINIPKYIADPIRDELALRMGLERAQIILNISHTHSGPAVVLAPLRFEINAAEQKTVENYTEKLKTQIVKLVADAFGTIQPVRLYSGNGVARFAVNRRNNTESFILQATELKGPSDHAVPVIKAVDMKGKIVAILFGYACHATVLGSYQISADYPGYAQTMLEKMYPGVVASFFQGAGGDQNPLPRRSVPLAKQYGSELAVAVERVLESEMKSLTSNLMTSYSETELKFANPVPTRQELDKMIDDTKTNAPWIINKAKVLRAQLDKGETLPSSYPYPVQVWRLGEQPVITLGGEIVVDYAIQLKRIFGKQLFVMGYSNDVMEYVPSARIIVEGGYEGSRSPIFSTPWRADIESRIIQEIIRLAEQVGLRP